MTSFADGAVLVTVLTRPGTTIGDFMLGRTTGGVWQWRPGEAAFALLLGTELPGNNGIEADPDQRRFYVVSFGLHAVLAFDRFDTAHPEQTVVAPDFMPDNIHWSDGRLLLAPAMNVNMWSHPLTQANVARLREMAVAERDAAEARATTLRAAIGGES